MRADWSEAGTGTVSDTKAWATDYATDGHVNDDKNLPTQRTE
jgi:hypothetical protein